MPWTSDAQRKWGNSPEGVAKLGQAKVNEFNQATAGQVIPDKVKKAHMAKNPHVTAIQDGRP